MGSYYGAIYYGEYGTEGVDFGFYGRALKLFATTITYLKLIVKAGV